jgi:hypothetical protein
MPDNVEKATVAVAFSVFGLTSIVSCESSFTASELGILLQILRDRGGPERKTDNGKNRARGFFAAQNNTRFLRGFEKAMVRC